MLLGELEDGIFSGRPAMTHGGAPAREDGHGAEDLLPEGGSGSEGQHHVPLEHLDLRGNRIGVHGVCAWCVCVFGVF